MTKLTEHFSMEDVTASETALRKGLDNSLPKELLLNVVNAAEGMERVRMLLGHAIYVNSWYRSAAVNEAVGGAKKSAHSLGYAVDFICSEFGSPQVIVDFLQKSSLPFDKVIQEGRWVHISFAPGLRRQVLTAHFTPGEKTTYTQGV